LWLNVDVCIVILQHSTFVYEHPGFVYEHPGFILRLILDGSAIRCEPDFSEFEGILLDVYNTIIKFVGNVPRVETKLFPDFVSCGSI